MIHILKRAFLNNLHLKHQTLKKAAETDLKIMPLLHQSLLFITMYMHGFMFTLLSLLLP